MEKRKRPSKEAMDRFARAIAPYMAEILAEEKHKEGESYGTKINTKRKTILKEGRS
jgi:hypothetical protein